MENKSTDELDIEIKNTENIKVFIEQNEEQFSKVAFYSYFHEICATKNIKASEIAKNADLGKSRVYELFGVSEKMPQRDTVIKLAFALSLDINQANRLLKLSGCGELYSKRKRDSIIIYCLNTSKSMYNTNEILFDEGLKPL